MLIVIDRGGFHRVVIRQEVAVLADTGDQYAQGQLQYLGSHDSRTKINQDVKYCWGGCRDGPATETNTRDDRKEMRGGERKKECKIVKGNSAGGKNILYVSMKGHIHY